MCKSFAIFAVALSLTGCSGARQFLLPFLGPSASDSTRVAIVTPPSLLEGRAAHHQDSLIEQLKFLQGSKPPKDLELLKLEFRNAPDSQVQLVATFTDEHRLNSHGLSKPQLLAAQNTRLLGLRPLWALARQSKLTHPLVIRAAFKHRDYFFQNAPLIPDTTEVVLPDSLAKPHK